MTSGAYKSETDDNTRRYACTVGGGARRAPPMIVLRRLSWRSVCTRTSPRDPARAQWAPVLCENAEKNVKKTKQNKTKIVRAITNSATTGLSERSLISPVLATIGHTRPLVRSVGLPAPCQSPTRHPTTAVLYGGLKEFGLPTWVRILWVRARYPAPPLPPFVYCERRGRTLIALSPLDLIVERARANDEYF